MEINNRSGLVFSPLVPRFHVNLRWLMEKIEASDGEYLITLG